MKVVPSSSAHIKGGLYQNYSIRANHRDMVRFAAASDDGFSFVVGELTKWIRHLQSDPEHRGMPPDLSRVLVLSPLAWR